MITESPPIPAHSESVSLNHTQRLKLCDGQASLTNDASQSTLRNFLVIRHNDTSIWICSLSEDDVAATLPIKFIANFRQCFDYVTARNMRQNNSSADLDEFFSNWWRNGIVVSGQTFEV